MLVPRGILSLTGKPSARFAANHRAQHENNAVSFIPGLYQ
jgi:hypothetical protein